MPSKKAVVTAPIPKLASAGPNPTAQPKTAMKQRTASARRKTAHLSRSKKTGKLARPAGEGQNLRCRYCGSDDLAPSFRRRRDARCRACFKQRYGSASLKKNKPVAEARARAK